MLTAGLHTRRQMFGGMPNYIKNMKRPPVIEEQPLPPIPNMAGGAPNRLNADFDSLMTQLGGQAPAQAPRMANAAPQGLMAPAKPAHQSGPSKGLLGSETFQKPDMTLSDKIGLISGMLMDYDGTFGEGNADKARGLYEQRVGEAQGTFEEQRQRKLMEAAAGGDMNAMFMLDPAMALGERRDKRNFRYGQERDQVGDDRYTDELTYGRGRDAVADDRYVDELTYGRSRDAVGDDQWERKFSAEQTRAAAEASGAGEYGLNVIWGYDDAGNYVPMQSGKSGGLIQSQVPEGVKLLGPGGTAFDSAMGKEEAKKAAYQTQAGQALTAFENKTNEIIGQIDTAMEQTNWMNTGFLGRMVFAGNLDATLDSIGAKAMLSELVAIKAQGGTLGALSDAEGKALRDAAVNVARSQNEKQLDANLKAYRLQVEKTQMNMRQAFEAEYVNGQQASRYRPPGGGATPPATSGNAPAQVRTDDDYDALPSGAIYAGPDGVRRTKP